MTRENGGADGEVGVPGGELQIESDSMDALTCCFIQQLLKDKE